MKFVALMAVVCFIASAHCEADLKIEDNGQYNFRYSVDDAGSHKRQEYSNSDGTISGIYSYIDANGDLRNVEYKAGANIGFQPTGDIGIDKKTAEKAAEMAALAPKVSVSESMEVKIPASPFTLPLISMPRLVTPVHYGLRHPVALPYAYSHHPLFWF